MLELLCYCNAGLGERRPVFIMLCLLEMILRGVG